MNNTYINKLLEGNKRYINNEFLNTNKNQNIRNNLFNKQTPFAVIITCSDSRVPPEIIFDLGLGEIFVIRTAGHIMDNSSYATLEYAINHLKIKLIVFMGHTNCGLIKGALKYKDNNSKEPNLNKVLKNLQSLVQNLKETDNREIALTKQNIYENIKYIKEIDKNFSEIIKENNIDIIPMLYDIKSGKVEIIKD